MLELCHEAAAPDPIPYPAGGDPLALRRLLIPTVIQAPSVYNTQPWQFRVGADMVEVFADRRRMITRIDPDGRQMIMSCGAALFYLRVALRHCGYTPQVALWPDPGVPDLLARVRLGPMRAVPSGGDDLFAAIAGRHTNRRPFAARPLPPALLPTLQAIVAADGAELYPIDDPATRAAVAALIATGDRLLWADVAFRQALAPWVHPNDSGPADGITGAGLGLGDGVSAFAPVLVRALDMGPRQAEIDRALAAGAPGLVVLGTREDTPAAWLAAGQALAHLLLAASAAGVAASFLNQAIAVPELRPRLGALLGRPTCPQVLLRLGYGPPTPATARRPVDSVLG